MSGSMMKLTIAAALAVLIVPASAFAEPDLAELREKLAAQERRLTQQERQIAELRADQDADWLNERRAEQVKTLVRDVLSDAETRASLLDSSITGGHDGAFFLASEDGNYRLNFKGLLQARYVYSHQNDGPGDDGRGGFEIARTRFSFSGHVIDPTWKFMIWTGHHDTGDAMLLDARITKVLDENWSVTAGQFKVPFWREWLVSETRLQMVERSLLNAFSGSYTQGVKVDYKNDQVHVTASFNDGLGGLNARWDTEDTDVAMTLRARWLVFGDWKQYADWQSWRGEDPMLVLGGAVHYQEGETGTPTDEVDIVRWTVDAAWELGGANLYAAVLGDRQDDGADFDRFGVLVQGGYFLTEKLELIARYEYADLDEAQDDTPSIATIGANYFFAKHAARLTFDIGYAFDAISDTIDSTFAGYRMDTPGEEGQVVVRTQMQLLF